MFRALRKQLPNSKGTGKCPRNFPLNHCQLLCHFLSSITEAINNSDERLGRSESLDRFKAQTLEGGGWGIGIVSRHVPSIKSFRSTL